MSIKHIPDITAKTLRMLPPRILANNKTKRKADTTEEINENLISHESFLRKLAYKNTTIKTDESFFNDSDMRSEYYLVVVYDKVLNTPLLSARYYFDKSLIAKSVNGYSNEEFNLNNFQEGEIFLADRLSGNINNPTYSKHRNYIFSLFYCEILTLNKSCSLLLMARKEKPDKLLNKYLSLGFHIVGSTWHKGKEHWIILTDLKKV